MDEFIWVEVEPCDCCPDGLSLRFKRAGSERVITRVAFSTDDGLDGMWAVCGLNADDGTARCEALASLVEDSSEGTTLLVVGGAFGLRLEHESSGRVAREAYLVLARETFTSPPPG